MSPGWAVFFAVVYWLEAVIFIRMFLTMRYRKRLLRTIRDIGYEDIHLGFCPMWRHAVYETVSFDRMIALFWKPLESFYPDKSFLLPTQGPRWEMPLHDCRLNA
jgi:hypothetical protein